MILVHIDAKPGIDLSWRRGLAMAPNRSEATPDPALVKLIVKAHRLHEELMSQDLGIGDIAASHGVHHSYVSRLIRLAFLSPEITEARARSAPASRSPLRDPQWSHPLAGWSCPGFMDGYGLGRAGGNWFLSKSMGDR